MDGPASRRKFVFGIVFLGALRWPPQIVIRYPAMVFMLLTRSGFDEVFPRLVKESDALWVNAGVLSESEVTKLREAGWNLTKWTNPSTDSTTEIDTVQLHHPDQVVWMETAARTDAG